MNFLVINKSPLTILKHEKNHSKFLFPHTFIADLGLSISKNHLPNVILILTDDQGWGDLSLNGNLDLSTPHIDKLARTGTRFDRFFVSPVCSPTRAEILTGRHHVRGGVYSTSRGGERLDIDEETIAEVFKSQAIKLRPMANGTTVCKPLFTPTVEGLMTIMVFVPVTGEIIITPYWSTTETW